MNYPKTAADLLKSLLRNTYEELDLYWTIDHERECEQIVDCLIDQAVLEARNERKGLANPRRRY